MKRFGVFLLSILIVFIAISCNCSSDKAAIVGKWELVRITGGIAGIDVTKESPDFLNYAHFDEIVFDEQSTIVRYKDGNVVFSASYKLETAKTISSLDPVPVIVTYHDVEDSYITPTYAYSFEDDGNTLCMMENVYDGFSYECHRVAS